MPTMPRQVLLAERRPDLRALRGGLLLTERLSDGAVHEVPGGHLVGLRLFPSNCVLEHSHGAARAWKIRLKRPGRVGWRMRTRQELGRYRLLTGGAIGR